MDLLIGEGVIQRNGDTLGDLAQQLQVGGGKYGFIALRQFKHAEHGVAGHQRQQAQGLDLVAPGVEQHAFVGGYRILFAEIQQQDLFAFEYPLGQRSGLVHFTLLVRRVSFIEVVGRVDVQLASPVAA